MPDENNILETIIDEIIDADCQQLLAGLTILAKDMSEYLAVNAYYGKDTQRFTRVYGTTLTTNRFLWRLAAPELYRTLEEEEITDKFAERVQVSNFTMEPLLNAALNQEWTRHPGWALLLAFRQDFSDVLCQQPDGLIAPALNTTGDNREFVISIAHVLLEKKFSSAPHWYPLTAQLSVLIAKAGLERYCESTKQ
ncbi:MAG: hypothetical protein KDD10_25380 [Phaeodactylibacter sp.]|nr:hypothetical protein [Phaeodactylibacter sp.]